MIRRVYKIQTIKFLLSPNIYLETKLTIADLVLITNQNIDFVHAYSINHSIYMDELSKLS